jgi:hypothetical protein
MAELPEYGIIPLMMGRCKFTSLTLPAQTQLQEISRKAAETGSFIAGMQVG